jgi:condensin complex subunit 3
MPVKKSESVGEKSIRFTGLFLQHASAKDNELLGEIDQDASVMPETPSTRLTAQLLEAILPMLTAKDKVVRFRSTHSTR